MILKYELPKEIEEQIVFGKEERLYYAVPFDIAEDGSWLADSYFVVTTKRLLLFRSGRLAKTYEIAKCRHVKAEAKIGGGILVLGYEGVMQYVVHYSAKHLSRYAYVARGIHILTQGRKEEVVSSEYEKICPDCGRAIPGTRYCPHCSKEGGFWRTFLKMARPYKKRFYGIIVLMVMAARSEEQHV